MKRFLILFTLVFIIQASNLMAQDENYLGLSFGAAIPQGIYASDDYDTEGAGYALTGFLFGFDVAWFPDDYLGIGATFTYGSNNPDKMKYKEDLWNDIKSRDSINLPDIENIVYEMGVWKYLNLHVGPTVTIPAGRFNFDVRVLGGITFAWQPNVLFQFDYENNGSKNFSHTRQNKAVTAFGYTAGVGVRYAFRSGLVLRLTGEFTNCKPSFEVTEEIELVEDDIKIDTRKVQVPIKNVQIGIGIAYNFEL